MNDIIVKRDKGGQIYRKRPYPLNTVVNTKSPLYINVSSRIKNHKIKGFSPKLLRISSIVFHKILLDILLYLPQLKSKIVEFFCRNV